MDEPFAFIIMAFNRPELDNNYTTVFEPILKEFGLKPYRVDLHNRGEPLTEAIFEKLDAARIIIADLTFERPNCYAEVGYLLGKGAQYKLILTARRDHDPRREQRQLTDPKVHFDLDSYHILWWDPDGTAEFSENLRERLDYRLGTYPTKDPGTARLISLPGRSTINAEAWANSQLARFNSQVTLTNPFLEFLSVVDVQERHSKKELLALATKAEGNNIGYPVGSIRGRSDNRPGFFQDGIAAFIQDGEQEVNCWALSQTLHFLALVTCWEQERYGGAIDGMSRIFHFSDFITYLYRLYSQTELATTSSIMFRFIFHNMKGIRLTRDNFEFRVHENSICQEDTFVIPDEGYYETTLDELRDEGSRIRIIERVGNDFFEMFAGLEIPSASYVNIYSRYLKNR